jgi:riboflavin-specific deaminase-like protein
MKPTAKASSAKRRAAARATAIRSSIKRTSRSHPPIHDESVPFVFSNFAMTADGKIAFADHRFQPFTSKRDLEHMLELRATADAVLSGAGTVMASAATLGPGGAKYRRLRRHRGLREFNLRIVVSGSGSLSPDAEIFQHPFSPIIVLTTQRAPVAVRRRLQAAGAIVKVCGAKTINFRAAFRWLKQKWDVQRLLCEGGGELHDALIRAGLMHELHLTISPQIFGGRTAPTLADGVGFVKLADAAQFQLKTSQRHQDELFLVYERIT